MEKTKIRQLMPLPEVLTPMQRITDETGNEVFTDVSGSVYVAVVENDDGETDVCHYVMDDGGTGSIGFVLLKKTVHCKRCGQRMTIADIPVSEAYNPHRSVGYRCPCGTACTASEDGFFYWSYQS